MRARGLKTMSPSYPETTRGEGSNHVNPKLSEARPRVVAGSIVQAGCFLRGTSILIKKLGLLYQGIAKVNRRQGVAPNHTLICMQLPKQKKHNKPWALGLEHP